MLRQGKLGMLVALLLTIFTAVAAAAPFAYISNSGSGTVSVVDTATNTVVTTIPTLGFLPWGVGVTPDGARAYVANLASNSVTVINGSTHTVIRTVAVGRMPFAIAVLPDGSKVFVTNSASGTMSSINAETFAVTPITVNSPRGVAVTPDGAKVFVVNNFMDTVTVFDAATHSVLGTAPVGAGPIGVAVSPDGSKVVVTNEADGTVSIINASNYDVLGTVTVGQNPLGVAISGDSRRAYVANSRGNSVSVVDLATRTIVAEVRVGNFPMGVSVLGSKVYVASRDSNRVDMIDALTNAPAGSIAVGLGPLALGQFIQAATRVDTALTLQVTPSEVVIGSTGPVALRGTLTRRDTGAPLSGASLAFAIGDRSLGSADTDPNGNAAWLLNPSSLKAGAYQVSVSFAESVIAGTTFNAARASGSFRVVFQWGGWKPPVMGGGTLNAATAGSAISMRWTMTDANGNPISSVDAVVGIENALIACAGDGITEISNAVGTGGRGLSADDAQFHFNWKTEKGWAGQCRAFMVRLADGTTRMAKFQFR